jgi:hypothetical protein
MFVTSHKRLILFVCRIFPRLPYSYSVLSITPPFKTEQAAAKLQVVGENMEEETDNKKYNIYIFRAPTLCPLPGWSVP